MDHDAGRRQLIAVLRARLMQQHQRGRIASVLEQRGASLQLELDDIVQHYAEAHAPNQPPKRRWWKFWSQG